jgi:nucleoside-diphosphate-sugar epimerase
MKHILITGGAGFIGSHTADLLLQQNLHVVVFDNFSTGKLNYLNVFHPNLRVVQADILDYPLLLKEISSCDAVLHLAAIASVPKSIENPIESFKTNTLGLLHVLQAIRECNKPIRLVYASSAAVYGHIEQLPCSDEQPLPSAALSPYALEKANNERYADLYARLFGIKNLGLRYFNVYGTRQDPKSPYSGVISKFIEYYRKNEPVPVFGNGEQSRDFIHVSDVARANVLALQSDYCGILNIATGIPETLMRLIHSIETAGGEKAMIEHMPERVGDIIKSYASTEKAERCLQFRTATTLANGIHDLLIGIKE